MSRHSEKASSLIARKKAKGASQPKVARPKVSPTNKSAGGVKRSARAIAQIEAIGAKDVQEEGLLYGTIPRKLLVDSGYFIDMTRKGIPGAWLKSVVDETGLRDVFVSLLDVTSGNFSRLYQKPALDKDRSEEVLDVVRLIFQAEQTWESRDLAMLWLSSPVAALGDEKPLALFDTFEGRGLVSQALNKIEHGEFS
jgi:putative toxin-antitoxin system antitoxin component (TIGR02293 family)